MQELIAHFRKYIHIDPEEEAEICSHFETVTIKKKQNLQEADSFARQHYFVIQGCLRLFFIDEKGAEQTLQFAIENWWLTDYLNFAAQGKSPFYIQAIEHTEVIRISFQQQEELLRKFPQLERYFRMIYQKAYGASQFRFKYMYDFSREAFYQHFSANFPEFTNRIPQQLLASFLNMTPEYLSEIKRKMLS